MNDKPAPLANVVPLREDGPKIAALLNQIDGGSRPTTAASVAGVHLDPALGLQPAVPGSLVAPPRETTFVDIAPAAHGGEDLDGEEQDESEEQGNPYFYGRKLHEAGEAAIAIVANLCEAEFAQGNPRNLPEPILGWYVMTLTYQLCVLEACNAPVEGRLAHAHQLDTARKAFAKYTGPYADSVREEVEDVLTRRKRWDDGDGTYGGLLPETVA